MFLRSGRKNIANFILIKCLVFIVLFLFVGTNFVSSTSIILKDKINPNNYDLGNTFYVGGSGPGNYTRIQDAIDNASNGDTVYVFSGTYFGYVIINKSIKIIGEDKNSTVIIGYFAFTVSIVSDWVNMNGFTIQNGGRQGEGVRIDSNYNIFSNNIIDIPNDRIRISGNSNIFSYNIVKDCYLYLSGDSNTVCFNTIINNYFGLYLSGSSDNIVSNNSFFYSGLFISDFNVLNNNVMNNTVNGKPLVYLDSKSDLILKDPVGQIILLNCTNITVKNQEIYNTTVGIQIWESNNCVVSGNTIIGNHYGICIYGLNNTLKDNTITSNYDAIHLYGEGSIVSGNTISNSNGNGIYLGNSDLNNIISNTITNNHCSILLDYGSDFNKVIDNLITSNNDAIRLSGNSNIISGNTISNSNGYGIYLGDSDFNNILNNNIKNNVYDGIYLFGDNNTISGNSINNNNNGIYVLRHNFNTIKDNNINLNNSSGIYMNSSCSNIVSGNSISKNRQGIYLFSSTDNNILKNNFLRNKQNAFFEDCTNIWNQNYWDRPRIFPKLIFGIKIIQNKYTLPIFDIDWHPAKEPYYI